MFLDVWGKEERSTSVLRPAVWIILHFLGLEPEVGSGRLELGQCLPDRGSFSAQDDAVQIGNAILERRVVLLLQDQCLNGEPKGERSNIFPF